MPNGAKLKTREEIKKLIEELSKNIETLKKEIKDKLDPFIESLNGEYNQLKEHFDNFVTDSKGILSGVTPTDPLINPQGVQELNFFINDKYYSKNYKEKIIEDFGKAREKLNTTEYEILNFLSDYREAINGPLSKCIAEFEGKIGGDKKLAEAEIKIDKVGQIEFKDLPIKCLHEIIEGQKTDISNNLSKDREQDKISDQLCVQKVIEG